MKFQIVRFCDWPILNLQLKIPKINTDYASFSLSLLMIFLIYIKKLKRQ